MNIADRIQRINAVTMPLAHLAAPLALLTRIHVGWVFVKSGWLKLSDWDSTLFLFREEYRVPLLPPDLAAVAGTTGELLFGLLVIGGLFGRLGALGLQAVNVLAVVSYAHVLLQGRFRCRHRPALPVGLHAADADRVWTREVVGGWVVEEPGQRAE